MEIKELLAMAAVKATLTETIAVDDDRQILVLTVKYKTALDDARKFAAISEQTGYSPLFAYEGNVEVLTSHVAKAGLSLSETQIAAASAFDLDAWVKDTKQHGKSPKVGDFSKQPCQMKELPHNDSLILIPVKQSWQIPSVLINTGWNSCPASFIHIAMLKRWYENYGARLMCKGKDSIYLGVERPITDRTIALAVAREQFAFCPDNVLQGSGDGTLSGAANDILGAKVWQFWWD